MSASVRSVRSACAIRAQCAVVAGRAAVLMPDQPLDHIGENLLSCRQRQSGWIPTLHGDLGMVGQYAAAEFVIFENQPGQEHTQAGRDEVVSVLCAEEE